MQLLINVDHVATLRNARGESWPDPVEAAIVCEKAGAAGIVFHLRGDRRHIRDPDIYRLREQVQGILVFEMAATDEMLEICSGLKPDLSTLVPESREELTTEGGLNMAKLWESYRDEVVPRLRESNIRVSLFLDPEPDDIRLAAKTGAEVIELHTGRYANAPDPGSRERELQRLADAAVRIHDEGMRVHAGHGLNLKNLGSIVERIPHLKEVSIGHAVISDAIFLGLEQTVKEYLAIIRKSPET